MPRTRGRGGTATRPDVECLNSRGRAHFWRIGRPAHVLPACKSCRRPRAWMRDAPVEARVSCRKRVGKDEPHRFHRWSPSAYAAGRCSFCGRKKLFRLGHPTILDWHALRRARRREEKVMRKAGKL